MAFGAKTLVFTIHPGVQKGERNSALLIWSWVCTTSVTSPVPKMSSNMESELKKKLCTATHPWAWEINKNWKLFTSLSQTGFLHLFCCATHDPDQSIATVLVSVIGLTGRKEKDQGLNLGHWVVSNLNTAEKHQSQNVSGDDAMFVYRWIPVNPNIYVFREFALNLKLQIK